MHVRAEKQAYGLVLVRSVQEKYLPYNVPDKSNYLCINGQDHNHNQSEVLARLIVHH